MCASVLQERLAAIVTGHTRLQINAFTERLLGNRFRMGSVDLRLFFGRVLFKISGSQIPHGTRVTKGQSDEHRPPFVRKYWERGKLREKLNVLSFKMQNVNYFMCFRSL